MGAILAPPRAFGRRLICMLQKNICLCTYYRRLFLGHNYGSKYFMGSHGFGNAAGGSLFGLISTCGPTEIDVVETAELEKLLADAGIHESREKAIKREEVLGRLDQIVKVWVKNVTRAKGFNEQLVQEANAKIFTFGSYRLGDTFW